MVPREYSAVYSLVHVYEKLTKSRITNKMVKGKYPGSSSRARIVPAFTGQTGITNNPQDIV